MNLGLKGKVALVTGANRGIGKCCALTLADEGCHVVICSRGQEALDQTAEELKGKDVNVLAVVADVTKLADNKKFVAQAVEKFGRIDILVNNAGSSPAMGSVLDSDERLWETVINLNLKGLYYTSQAVARVMKKQGGGRIINIASIDGFKPEPGVSIYSISKAGVRMVTRAFAAELAPFNIRVNTIAPGPIGTKMLDSHWFHLPPEEAKKAKEAMGKLTWDGWENPTKSPGRRSTWLPTPPAILPAPRS